MGREEIRESLLVIAWLVGIATFCFLMAIASQYANDVCDKLDAQDKAIDKQERIMLNYDR